MANNKWQRVIAVVCVASFLVTSCSTLHRVSIPGSETSSKVPAVQVNDTVVITTKAGDKQTFKVIAIEPDALVGKDMKKNKEVRVAYTDMATLSLKHYTGSSNALTVMIVVGVVAAVVAGVAIADSTDEALDAIGGN